MQEGGLNFLQGDRRAAQLEGGGETKGTCSLCVSGPGCHPSTAWQSMELNFFAWPSSKHRELRWYVGDVRSASDFKQKYPSGLYYSFRRFQKVKVMICWFFFAPPNRYFPPKSLKHCRCSSIAMYEASQVTLSASPTRAVLLQPPLAVPQGFVLFGWFGVHSPPCSLPLTFPACLRNVVQSPRCSISNGNIWFRRFPGRFLHPGARPGACAGASVFAGTWEKFSLLVSG